jgi:hypothetical protein
MNPEPELVRNQQGKNGPKKTSKRLIKMFCFEELGVLSFS